MSLCRDESPGPEPKRKREPALKLFVPGRLCLFGEHSDWAGGRGLHQGYCLVIGTDQGLRATARASDEFVVETVLPPPSAGTAGGDTRRRRSIRCAWDASALEQAARDREEFFRHCAGVAHELHGLAGVTGGIELAIERMDLPLKKGVSSSAAVCVLVASAFNRVYGLGLFSQEIMELAYRGERLTGSQCGRMDQACAFGKVPVLLEFTGDQRIRVEPLFPQREMTLFFVDLAGEKDTVRILTDLQAAYERSRALQEALGPDNERIVRRAYRALTEGDAEELGGLMTRAQKLFDRKVAPHSPAQLASPLLHELLAMDELRPHVWGAKGVGSQGDGTAQFVARSPADREAAMALIARRFGSMRCFPLSVLPVAGR